MRDDHEISLTPGYISELDDAVGSIISKLKGAGVYEDTVVVFSSDNGALTRHPLILTLAITTTPMPVLTLHTRPRPIVQVLRQPDSTMEWTTKSLTRGVAPATSRATPHTVDGRHRYGKEVGDRALTLTLTLTHSHARL